VLALLAACSAGAGRGASPPAAANEAAADTEKPADEKAASDDTTLTLTDEQVAHLGIETTELTLSHHAAEVAGYGLIMPRDAIAPAQSERSTAEAAVTLSRAGLARERELAGTPGALASEAREALERQAAVDEAAAALARSHLSALLGDHPAWGERESTLLEQLEQGKIKLVRATFPLGVLEEALPTRLRVARLGNSAISWRAAPVWRAPADAAVPGRALFALLHTDAASDGEHVLAMAAGNHVQTGVVIPLSAVVMHDGRYWCYLRRTATSFERVEFDADMPAEHGYFVTTGPQAGDSVVTQSAGLLLARQTGKADDTD
jgi:hypothetical protein